MTFMDLYHTFDRRLNNPVWLCDRLGMGNENDIAHEIGCSANLVRRKVADLNIKVSMDRIFDVHTGYFHWCKRFFMPLLKTHIKKIQSGVDSVYSKTKSQNSEIFKKIIEDMDMLDDDTEKSTFGNTGMTRKEAYLLLMKFVVCLYEYDMYYAERIDYILKRLREEQSELYSDTIGDIGNPKAWYPHRPTRAAYLYMKHRNKKMGDEIR